MKNEQTTLPEFQTQILKNDFAVILSEKDSKTTLCIGGLEKIESIYDVMEFRNMLNSAISNYLDVYNDEVEECDCDNCDECHVGPCYCG